jgi:hypothetical protein
MPPLPIEPTDAKAIEALAEDTHRKNIEVTQDVGRINGWLAAIVRWPFRQLLRITRR